MNKKNLFGCMALLALTAGFTACSNDDDVTTGGGNGEDVVYNWSEDGGKTACDHLLFNSQDEADANGTQIGNGESEFVFKGTQTLKKGTYHLKGWVYVADGSTLTIEPGTVIKGDKETMAALIVERGGKLMAQGTVDEPIVFTSEMPKGERRPGDWGGVILCGRANNNQNNDMQIEGGPRTHHGGTNDADNSGVLSYVRIEFAGYPFQTDKEINGLTLGSVGSETQIDHVQVSYSNDDSFEWFGGKVNCKYLIAYKGWDDDFDTDNGFSGNVQYGLAIRDPKIADTSKSNGFESDNCAGGDLVSPYTTAVFSNITFIGPRVASDFRNEPDYITAGDYKPNNNAQLGLFQAAMQIRRSSRLNCFNSVAVGFPIGLIIDGEKGNTVEQAKAGTIKLQNIWFANMGILGSDANNHYVDELYDATNKSVLDANKESYSSTFFKSFAGNRNVANADAWNLTSVDGMNVNFMPAAGSPLMNAASFTDSYLNNSWFDKVNFIGAISPANNWLEGWTNFDPQHADY